MTVTDAFIVPPNSESTPVHPPVTWACSKYSANSRSPWCEHRTTCIWYLRFVSAPFALAPMYESLKPSRIKDYQSGVWSPGWTLHRADFSPDAREDLFLYNESTGRWFGVIVEAGGGNRYVGGWVLPANAQPMVLDFNADNESDVLLYDPIDGGWRLYLYHELQSDLCAPAVTGTGHFGSNLTLIRPT